MLTFTVVWVALTAAPPVDVVVTDSLARGATLATLKKALPGDVLLEASELFAGLQPPPGLFDFQDFGAFSAPPTAGWPAALGATWRESLAYCREISGPSPWGVATMPGARCCGQRLSRYLWGRYLAEQKAKAVFVVFATPDEGKVTVTGSRYAPGEGDELVVTREGRVGEAEALVREVTGALVAEAGVRSRRVEVPVLFEVVAGDPWAEARTVTPVPNLKTCAQLPSALAVETRGNVAPALTQRWAASVKGQGAPLTCTLRFSSHHELPDAKLLASATDPVITTVLDCGEVTVAAELMRGPLAKAQSDAVAARLVSALAARLCR